MGRPTRTAAAFLAEAADQSAAGAGMLDWTKDDAAEHEELCLIALALSTLLATSTELTGQLAHRLDGYADTRILTAETGAGTPTDQLQTAGAALRDAHARLAEALIAARAAARSLAHLTVEIDLNR